MSGNVRWCRQRLIMMRLGDLQDVTALKRSKDATRMRILDEDDRVGIASVFGQHLIEAAGVLAIFRILAVVWVVLAGRIARRPASSHWRVLIQYGHGEAARVG